MQVAVCSFVGFFGLRSCTTIVVYMQFERIAETIESDTIFSY